MFRELLVAPLASERSSCAGSQAPHKGEAGSCKRCS